MRDKKTVKANPPFNYLSRNLHTSPQSLILQLEFGPMAMPACKEEWETCLLQLKIQALTIEDKRERVRISGELVAIIGL